MARRLAWGLGVPHRNPDTTHSGAALSQPLLAVLGMHRSGTSAVAGMLEDQGFSTGIGVEPKRADNPFGTRENRDLVQLDTEVLELNGCDWDEPPTIGEPRFTAHYIRRRNRLVNGVATGPALLKDPRMVLLREFWKGVPLQPIGVIRNPIAVTDSLRRREPTRTIEECLHMWHSYNTHLLRWLRIQPFPVIEFGGLQDLGAELALALDHYDLPAPNSFRFFDSKLIRASEQGMEWRQEVPVAFSHLWDEILTSYRPEFLSGVGH